MKVPMGVRKRVRPCSPLHLQFRHQKRLLGLTTKRLAALSKKSQDTIVKALHPKRIQNREVISQLLAMSVGDILHFDPVYVAVSQTRDLLNNEENRDGVAREDKALYRRLREQFDEYLRWGHPFKAEGSGIRQAFRAERRARRCQLSELADKLAQRHPTHSREAHEEMLRLYEHGKLSVDPGQLEIWLDVLTDGDLQFEQLASCAKGLLVFHSVANTLETQVDSTQPGYSPSEKTGLLASSSSLRFFCPEEQGYSLRWLQSPTIFGAIDVDVITAELPKAVDRSRVRLVSARHPGFEMAVLTKGRVLITLSEQPFLNEELNKTPNFRCGENGVVKHTECRATEILTFPSGLYHRVEFLEGVNESVSFNIRRNVDIHRRVKYPGT